ncbi:DUF1722 domain-containing protein [Brevibacillus laterosporus]|uniref:DUF1722 domain-containing protein n=1 Tax=Brevibacillus laterosporus TaxID=1465 RepID=A0A518VB25_BRELA|nr:DUF1722 domain-containing protein [Brevibacillus laterosporus]
METAIKPIVVVSKCLEFAECRYNGAVLSDITVQSLTPYVTFVPICPEVEIGLGIPRETIRIIKEGEQHRLVQPSTRVDLSTQMNAFSDHFLQNVREVDGFILKNRSPSCGVKDVKVYSGWERAPVVESGPGFFGNKVEAYFPHAAIEEEGRLKNFTIREHFFTKLFTQAYFRHMQMAPTIQKLIQFHAENKYLFMSYNQKLTKELGKIVANHDKKTEKQVWDEYAKLLPNMFKRTARYTSNINVCQHIMGYFSKELSSKEKEHFMHLLSRYRERKLPLSSMTSLLKSWVYRYEQEYLLRQRFFEPYPEGLIDLGDSGKGRDY